jgi:integrase
MASISREPNGRRTIQFVGPDHKRKSIRLGKVNQKAAEAIKAKVEALLAFALARSSWDEETAKWVGEISNDLSQKLAAVGLIPARDEQKCEGQAEVSLGTFIDMYANARTDVKQGTRLTYQTSAARLIDFFGADRLMHLITPGEADDWLIYLRSEYAGPTIAKTVKHARQFFRSAIRKGFAKINPFSELKTPGQANMGRSFFITTEMAGKVFDACPDHEWRLIFALSRYAGLLCHSEHLALQWSDVDWGRERFLVRSAKKEHLEDHGERWVPIFPELRPYLEEAFEQAEEGAVYVINRYRDTNQNLRTQLSRIIRRAGLKPWPRPFQNLRSSRETELAESFPLHVVCQWIGNTARVATAHYLQVTEDHFKRAAKSGAVALQNAVQQPAAPSGTGSQERPEPSAAADVVRSPATVCGYVQDGGLAAAGFEPASPLRGEGF